MPEVLVQVWRINKTPTLTVIYGDLKNTGTQVRNS